MGHTDMNIQITITRRRIRATINGSGFSFDRHITERARMRQRSRDHVRMYRQHVARENVIERLNRYVETGDVD